jgi:hypothetical protein
MNPLTGKWFHDETSSYQEQNDQMGQISSECMIKGIVITFTRVCLQPGVRDNFTVDLVVTIVIILSKDWQGKNQTLLLQRKFYWMPGI